MGKHKIKINNNLNRGDPAQMPRGCQALPVQTATVSGVPHYNVRANPSSVPVICAAVKKKGAADTSTDKAMWCHLQYPGTSAPAAPSSAGKTWVACTHPGGDAVPQPGGAGSPLLSQSLSCETAHSPPLLQEGSSWRNQHELCQGQESPSALSHQVQNISNQSHSQYGCSCWHLC